MSEYAAFLETKAIVGHPTGREITDDQIHPSLFGFQRDLVRWSIRKGRAALFATTGMVSFTHTLGGGGMGDDIESRANTSDVRHVRHDVREVPERDQARTGAILLAGLQGEISGDGVRTLLRDVRREVLPGCWRAVEASGGAAVLYSTMLRRVARDSSQLRYVHQDGDNTYTSHRGGGRTRPTPGPARSCPSHRLEQAEQSPVQLGRLPESVLPRSLPRWGDVG